MDQYHPGKHAYSNPAAIDRTAVYRLEIELMKEKGSCPNSSKLVGHADRLLPQKPSGQERRGRVPFLR